MCRFTYSCICVNLQTKLDLLDAVVDVGGVFDPARSRFDHHQRGFNRRLEMLDSEVQLSSAGLIYEFYGKEVIKNILQGYSIQLSENELEVLYKKVCKDSLL